HQRVRFWYVAMSMQVDGSDAFSIDHHLTAQCGRLRESRAHHTASSKRSPGQRASSMVEKFSTVCRHTISSPKRCSLEPNLAFDAGHEYGPGSSAFPNTRQVCDTSPG